MGFVLKAADLEPLLLGGAFFGCGGGGTITSARHLVKHFQMGDYYPTDEFEVVSVEEATEGDTVMVAYMGAPQAINSATHPLGPVEAARQVQAKLAAAGRKLAYVVSPESGALGFVVAGLVAAKLGLRVIDADGAGRAVPSLPMLTYAQAEISPRPTILVSQSGLSVELDVTPRAGSEGGAAHQQDVAVIVEQMTRPIVAAQEFNEFGGLAMWVMSPQQVPVALPIRGTLSRALQMGHALQQGTLNEALRVADFLSSQFGLAAKVVSLPGKIVSAQVDTTGGFDLGKVKIDAGSTTYTVLYQNESILVWDSTQPAPMVISPDSVSYFVEGAGQAVFSNGDLVLADGALNPEVRDRTVYLLAWPADSALTQPGSLILDCFMDLLASMGYLGPYIPLGTASKELPA